MEFVFHTSRLLYVKTYFLAAAETLAGMLKAPFSFNAKLNVLTVEVYEDRMRPSCFHHEDNNSRCVIELHIDMLTLDTEMLLVASHELAHLMMSTMGAGRHMTLADGSRMAYSTVHRCDKDGQAFGLGLEEALADLISLEVTRRAAVRLDIPRRSVNYAIRMQEAESKLRLQAAAAFARCFGKPLARLSALDEMKPLGKQVVFFNPNGDELCVTEAANAVANLFWYFLSNDSFPEIARKYDELMGAGAYAALCRKFDDLYLDQCDRVTYTHEEQMLRAILSACDDTPEKRLHGEIMASIEQFSKSWAASDQRLFTLPLANQSLREVINHMRRRVKAAVTHPVDNDDGCPSPLREELLEVGKRLSLASPMKSLLQAGVLFDRIDAAYGEADTPYAVHLTALRDMFKCSLEVIGYYKPALVKEIRGGA